MILIIGLLLACVVTAIALVEDRNGDVHPNHDLLYVVIISMVMAWVFILIDPRLEWRINLLRHLLLSLCIYVAVFPYAVNIMQMRTIRNHKIKWWDHLSGTAWPDRTGWWQATPWYGRMLVALWVLILGLSFYIHPCWVATELYKGCPWYNNLPVWY